jgi:hypothetical protein
MRLPAIGSGNDRRDDSLEAQLTRDCMRRLTAHSLARLEFTPFVVSGGAKVTVHPRELMNEPGDDDGCWPFRSVTPNRSVTEGLSQNSKPAALIAALAPATYARLVEGRRFSSDCRNA